MTPILPRIYRLTSVAALSVAAACAAASPGSPKGRPGVVPVSGPASAAVASVASPHSAPQAPSPAAPLELFARLDGDLATAHPRLVKVDRAAHFYLEKGGPVASRVTPSGGFGSRGLKGEKVFHRARSLEADPGQNRPFWHILCEERALRVAVYVAATDLATVTVDHALIVASLPLPMSPTALTPGVRLAPGAVVEIGAVANGAQQVRYEGSTLDAEGLLDATRIGSAYVPNPNPQPADTAVVGQLSRTARFLDAPNGKELAHVERYEGGRLSGDRSLFMRNFSLVVHKLGPTKGGFMLVRSSDDHASIVGWVAQSAIKRVGAEPEVEGNLFGNLAEGLEQERAVATELKIARGSLLLGEDGAAVGVVLSPTNLECLEECTTPEPVVLAPACGSRIRVRAVPPRT